MGKFEQKKKKKHKRKKRSILPGVLIGLLIVAVIVAAAVFVMPQVLYQIRGGEETVETVAQVQTEEASHEVETTETQIPVVEFPACLDSGKIEIESLFQFDGINPDCGNQEGTNIASLVVNNVSGEYLAEAKITALLLDGTELNFTITDLPAGKSAMVFSTENLSIAADASCVDITCETVYDNTASAVSDRVQVLADGMNLTVTNISGESIFEIVVYCRSPFGEDYFGGVTYQYTVNDLPAGGTANVTAVDCILGMAEVVRIAIN